MAECGIEAAIHQWADKRDKRRPYMIVARRRRALSPLRHIHISAKEVSAQYWYRRYQLAADYIPELFFIVFARTMFLREPARREEAGHQHRLIGLISHCRHAIPD